MKTILSSEDGLAGSLSQTRRDFLKLLGGGIVVLINSPESAQAQDRLPNSYLRIGEDGTITIFTGKVEMGQGVMTALAQMAAEELDAPISVMRAVMGDTGLCPVDSDSGTWGSLTIRNFGPTLRSAGAKARAVLIELAAQQLGLPADQLFTRDASVISRADESVRLSYASLAGGKTVEVHLATSPKVKDAAEFTLSGKPVLRIDAVAKVTGKAKYTADIRSPEIGAPEMLYACILRPPAQGAKLKPESVDTSAAEKIARVVKTGSLIATLHENPEVAAEALALVQGKAQWDLPQTGSNEETIHQDLLPRAPAGQIAAQKGDLSSGERLALAKVEQTYYTPYVAHAPIEPHAAVASVTDGKLTVWASTQTPFALGSQVGGRVITPFVGGAFGGKALWQGAGNQQATEAVQLAKATGQPVQVAWTREEEFFYDTFQPISVIKIRAGVDSDHKISFWDSQVYFVGNFSMNVMFYDLPNHRTQVYGSWTDGKGPHPFTIGPWRAPGNCANTFARESHFDALAAAAGMDPVEFRLLHLKNARLRKVLETAAENFGWRSVKTPSGRGCGVACGEYNDTYVVMMAEIAVDRKTGAIKATRMLCAQDMGRVINPDGARMQMEGSMMMGLGYALSEEMHFNKGAILDLNFDTYELPRFSWMPQIETVLVGSDATALKGGGEPPIITVGAVLANALFDAIGVRPNRLPMTPPRVLAMLQRSSLLVMSQPARVGDQIRLSWNGGPGIQLQKTTTLTQPVWQEVPNTDGQSSITLPASEISSCFRLIKP